MTTTPLLGLTVPDPDGNDDAGLWPYLAGQGLRDLENSLMLTLDSKSATDPITSWPNGFSLMGVSQANGPAKGWPDIGGGVIFTMHRVNEVLAHQWYMVGSALSQIIIQIRAGTSAGWSAWQQIVSAGTPRAMASGQVTGTPPTGGGTVAMPVVFPYNRFASAPRVQVSADSTLPGQCQVSYSGVTATGCTVYLNRTNNTPTSVSWQAVEGVDG